MSGTVPAAAQWKKTRAIKIRDECLNIVGIRISKGPGFYEFKII